LSFGLAQHYAAEMVNALEYLKGKGIAHRDIKPKNILLDENFDLKITDFGTAKSMNIPLDEYYRQEDYGQHL
jgi:3-phosphoinositide dependent protein kinase-1